MHKFSIYIQPEDIVNKFSDEDKKKFNQCVFTDVRKDFDGGVTIDCLVFNDPDPYVKGSQDNIRYLGWF